MTSGGNTGIREQWGLRFEPWTALSGTLGLLAVLQFATWAPHRLFWPLYADHDVFATAARAWDAGILPYRDLLANNFPGTTYEFWILGRLFGWGATWPFFAVDAALTAVVALLLLRWSRQVTGWRLPGWVGVLSLLSCLLSLDYSLTAQRDTQGPLLAIAGLLWLQAGRGPLAVVLSAVLTAIGFSIRPQVALFLPGVVMSWRRGEQPGSPMSRSVEGLWAITFIGTAALTCLPLLVCGIFDDFLNGVALAAPGSRYARLNPGKALKGLLEPARHLPYLSVAAALGLLWPLADARVRAVARPWIVTTLAVSLCKPLSAVPHAYLELPLRLVWSVDLAILAAMVSGAGLDLRVRLAMILALVGMGGVIQPRFCQPGASLEAVAAIFRGDRPPGPPTGYAPNPRVPAAAVYPWDDYQALLDHLRTHTDPASRIANALKEVPAITGALGRLPAFPAESVAWLKMVRPEDEPAFVQALTDAPGGTAVVWIPGEVGRNPLFQFPALERAIREQCVPQARFGQIEVWRKPGEAAVSVSD